MCTSAALLGRCLISIDWQQKAGMAAHLIQNQTKTSSFNQHHMALRRALSLSVLSAACIAGLNALYPANAQQSVDCWLNDQKQLCTIKPSGKGGMEISFSGGAIYRFVPAGPPTTEQRLMRDERGNKWLMSGHHSFELEEQGGYRNRISVSSVRSQAAPSINHSSHSKVKLTGHGQNTVTLYAKPSFGAAIAGMGVSGETLDKLACTENSMGTWCRVGYPGQSGRVLWVHRDSLIFIGDGE